MDKEQIVQKIKSHTKDNKISCKQAMKIAEEEEIPTRDIGEMLNEMKIKIMGCQLGCFP